MHRPKRIIVEELIAEEFTEQLFEHVDSLVVGDPTDPAAQSVHLQGPTCVKRSPALSMHAAT